MSTCSCATYHTLLNHTSLPLTHEQCSDYQDTFNHLHTLHQYNYQRVGEDLHPYPTNNDPTLRYSYFGPYAPADRCIIRSSSHGDLEWLGERSVNYRGALPPLEWLWISLLGRHVTAIYLPKEATALHLTFDLEVTESFSHQRYWGPERYAAFMDISLPEYSPCFIRDPSWGLSLPNDESSPWPLAQILFDGQLFQRYEFFAPHWPLTAFLQVEGAQRLIVEFFNPAYQDSYYRYDAKTPEQWQSYLNTTTTSQVLPPKLLAFQTPFLGRWQLLGDLARYARPRPALSTLLHGLCGDNLGSRLLFNPRYAEDTSYMTIPSPYLPVHERDDNVSTASLADDYWQLPCSLPG